jgi:hypothetical protein
MSTQEQQPKELDYGWFAGPSFNSIQSRESIHGRLLDRYVLYCPPEEHALSENISSDVRAFYSQTWDRNEWTKATWEGDHRKTERDKMRSIEPDDMHNIDVGTMLEEIQPDMEIYVAHYYASRIAAFASVLVSKSQVSSGLEPGGIHYQEKHAAYLRNLGTYINHFPDIARLYPPPHLDTLIMQHMMSDNHHSYMNPAEIMTTPPRPS